MTLCCIDLLRPTVCISYSLYLSIHQASAALVDTLLFDAELALFVHSETLNRDCSRHTLLSSFCISVHSRVASLHGEAVSVHTMLQRACHANVTDMQCRFTLCCQFAESMATCNSMPDPQKYKLQQRRSTLCCIDLLRPTVCISYSLYPSNSKLQQRWLTLCCLMPN